MNNSSVRVYSEFQPLEEVILGKTYQPESYNHLQDMDLREMLQKVARETEEDFQSIKEVLESQGVIVKRPNILFDLYKTDSAKTSLKMLDVGAWQTGYPTPPVWPRDLNITYGNKILSTYARTTNRWLESQHYSEIFNDYFQKGADWISMPPPLLNMQADSYNSYEEKAILFHAACFLRCGKDIFHTLPASQMSGAKGTSGGLEWIKRQLGDVRFHAVKRIGHLDGKIALIKPGLLISWIPQSDLPECLQSWDIIYLEKKGDIPAEFEAMRGKRYYKDFVSRYLSEWVGYVDETYFDVNLISLNENLVLMNGHNLDLEKKLKAYGVDCIPTNFRHRYFWDGGLHCITLDTKRSGECENYF